MKTSLDSRQQCFRTGFLKDWHHSPYGHRKLSARFFVGIKTAAPALLASCSLTHCLCSQKELESYRPKKGSPTRMQTHAVLTNCSATVPLPAAVCGRGNLSPPSSRPRRLVNGPRPSALQRRRIASLAPAINQFLAVRESHDRRGNSSLP